MSITAKTLKQNKLNGILAEIIAIQDFLSNGYEIKRTRGKMDNGVIRNQSWCRRCR